MTHNPYSPPSAPVSDSPEVHPPRGPRPWQVTRAIYLCCLSLAFAVPGVVHGILTDESIEDMDVQLYRVILAAFMALIFAVIVWVVVSIYLGRRWARLVYAALTALGVISAWTDVPEAFSTAWFYGVLYLSSTALDVAIVVLLFMAEPNAWFSQDGRRAHR
jgi:hypothetical protein